MASSSIGPCHSVATILFLKWKMGHRENTSHHSLGLKWRRVSFCVSCQHCNIISVGKAWAPQGQVLSHSTEQGGRKRSRPQGFSANTRLCLCAQVGQLFLFFLHCILKLQSVWVLEPPAAITVPIFAAHSSSFCPLPSPPRVQAPRPLSWALYFRSPAPGLLCCLPCTHSSPSGQQPGHLGILNYFTIGPEPIFSVGFRALFKSMWTWSPHNTQGS